LAFTHYWALSGLAGYYYPLNFSKQFCLS